MENLILLSNGFFTKDVYKGRKYNVEIDYNEEAQFDEIENDDTFNVMVDEYNFDINDLADLKAVNGNNILKEYEVDKEEYMYIAENHYIEYCQSKDLLKVIITIYDYDKFANKDLVNFIEKFGRCIEIIINTKEEKDLFMKKLDNYFVDLGYEDTKDFIKKESEEI